VTSSLSSDKKKATVHSNVRLHSKLDGTSRSNSVFRRNNFASDKHVKRLESARKMLEERSRSLSGGPSDGKRQSSNKNTTVNAAAVRVVSQKSGKVIVRPIRNRSRSASASAEPTLVNKRIAKKQI